MNISVPSPAKINWTLRVIRRREDGYHELESLVLTVTLHDQLTFSLRSDDRFILTCQDATLPCDDRNLVCRAAAALAAEARRGAAPGPLGASCHLEKRIPIGGGLGGGSSNAATALQALNRLWGLDWPVDRLAAIAAGLGSDVPLFLHGPAAVISGRGERVRPVRLGWPIWIVLILPGFPIATADVYRAWRPSEAGPAVESEDPAGWVLADRQNRAVRLLERAYNMLEPPAMRACPPLRGLLDQLAALAGRPVRLSGSGSTLFTAFDDRPEAEAFAGRTGEQAGLETRVVRPMEQEWPAVEQV